MLRTSSLVRGAQGAALGFLAGAALDAVMGQKAAEGAVEGAAEEAAPTDDDAIAAYVAEVPSLAAALDAVGELAKRLDPLFMTGARWWSGRLVALAREATAASDTASAARFKREVMTLLGAAAGQLLEGEPSEQYRAAVDAAVSGVAGQLSALVTAVGARVRAGQQ